MRVSKLRSRCVTVLVAVWGLGFGVEGLGFRQFRVEALGFRIQA